LQKILFPADVLIIMSEPNLKNALDQITQLEQDQLLNLKATDTRTLIKSKEIQTMVLAAKMTLQASLMRKETREGLFYRDDFNDVDNKNWLKWIIVEKGQNEAMNFTTVAIPFAKYKYQPDLTDLT
jgi:succinate dehydrogenase/fumarate reductase flavoprotein subunit